MVFEREVEISAGVVTLEGRLVLPDGAAAIVLFAHGGGSSRLSPPNRYIAQNLTQSRFASLLFDLLTPEEEAADTRGVHLRFDIPFLARRLIRATYWALTQDDLRHLPLGYFGASTGAAAALLAAAQLPEIVKVIVSRGGRPDLAGPALPKVRAPTLLIVGELDRLVLQLNEAALSRIGGEARLEVVPGATHLLEKPGALEQVVRLARYWFEEHLLGASREVHA